MYWNSRMGAIKGISTWEYQHTLIFPWYNCREQPLQFGVGVQSGYGSWWAPSPRCCSELHLDSLRRHSPQLKTFVQLAPRNSTSRTTARAPAARWSRSRGFDALVLVRHGHPRRAEAAGSKVHLHTTLVFSKAAGAQERTIAVYKSWQPSNARSRTRRAMGTCQSTAPRRSMLWVA
jgi:hypothetical protein